MRAARITQREGASASRGRHASTGLLMGRAHRVLAERASLLVDLDASPVVCDMENWRIRCKKCNSLMDRTSEKLEKRG